MLRWFICQYIFGLLKRKHLSSCSSFYKVLSPVLPNPPVCLPTYLMATACGFGPSTQHLVEGSTKRQSVRSTVLEPFKNVESLKRHKILKRHSWHPPVTFFLSVLCFPTIPKLSPWPQRKIPMFLHVLSRLQGLSPSSTLSSDSCRIARGSA